MARLSNSYISGDVYQLAGRARIDPTLPVVKGLVQIGPRVLTDSRTMMEGSL